MESKAERWDTLRALDNWLEKPMLLLSFVWLVLLLVELIHGITDLLETFGTLIWAAFILEFALRFTLAPEKTRFLQTNWLTIIALIVPALRLFRVFSFLKAARALRGVRLVRVVGSLNRGMNALRRTLKRRQFGYVLALTSLVLFLGAAGMYSFEPAPEIEAGFTSYGHALWWTGMLIASIGTDFWPITAEGRLLSALLSIYGLAVFGYITASFASFFVGRDAEAPDGEIAGASELALLRAELEALRQVLQLRTESGGGSDGSAGAP